MEQIHQHEWGKTGIVYQDRCIYCYLHKFTSANTSFFLDLYGNKTTEEPACITRYPEQRHFEPQEDYMTWCQYCKTEVMASQLIGNEHGHFICEKCYNKTT